MKVFCKYLISSLSVPHLDLSASWCCCKDGQHLTNYKLKWMGVLTYNASVTVGVSVGVNISVIVIVILEIFANTSIQFLT